MKLPPHLRPIMVNRIATCLNCKRRLYARAGDWVPAYSQPVQQWVHWNKRSHNRYCNDLHCDDYLMAEVDLSTIEWVKEFERVCSPLSETLVVVDFYRPKHRREPGLPHPYAIAS